jgi:hypothetical protein
MVPEFRTTLSWQQAIELGPQLVRLAEELPASEQLGLCWQLQQSMVDLPAAIALDLLEDGSYTRRAAALKLVATLELIEKVYPALDTLQLRKDAQTLVDRISSDRFTEQTGGAKHAPAAPAPAPAAPAPAPAPTPAPAPASTPITPETVGPTSQPQPTAPVSVQVEGQPNAEGNV